MADTQIYGTMCTDIGNAAIANSVLTGTKVNFTQIAVGDANGTPYVPVSGMTELKHQVWSGPIGEVTQDPEEANRMILHAVLPSSVGGWVMREIGVLDDQGRLIAVGNTPEIPKEVVTTGAIMEMDLYIYISVVDARGVNVVIDPTVVIASKADVNKLQQLLDAHKADTNNPHGVTAEQTGAQALINAHKSDQTVHVTTLGCTKSGRVYQLTGLTASSGLVPCVFKADADYVAGNTVTIDGTEYTLKTRDGSALTAGAWAAGAVIRGVADADNKVLYVEPSRLPNHYSLNILRGYGGRSIGYDGSETIDMSVPYITFHTSEPGSVANGELWAVDE